MTPVSVGTVASGRPAIPKPVENCSEFGNARRLVTRHGAQIRYVHPWKKWLVYGQGRWQIDANGAIERLAKETVCSIYQEAADAGTADDRQELAKWAARCESHGQLRAMIDLAVSEPGIPVRPDELDADPWRFNLRNGTLDLRTGQLHTHTSSDLLTKSAPVDYHPEARAPTWDAFLARILAADDALIAFLQRAIGYSLTGNTGEQVLFFLYGTGANGKSTLLEALRALLGDYAQQTDFTTFLDRRGEGPRNDIAALQGARLVAATETGDGRKLAEGLVKQLTGGDTISARKLYSEFFQFRPQFKLWLAANHKPVIRGTDHAIWRRIRMIPFTVTIPEPERDPELGHRLVAEFPGILRWAVEGCLAWQRDRLGAAPAVQEATESYRSEMDVVGGFLDDCCEVGPSLRAFATPLYQAYRQWCERTGERSVSQRGFGQALQERDFTRVRSTRGAGAYYGLQLTQSDASDPSDHFSGNSSCIPPRERTFRKTDTKGHSRHSDHDSGHPLDLSSETQLSLNGGPRTQRGDAYEGT